ncbi:Bacterial type II secretion system protein F domain protein [Anatilimnocola aggregata]|uniref:Bacterial type II secretion system protein F domain protein n=1 Tax=Anatilimnocola aggregata TaxID=2528021 RepID=A0A517YIG9_9BACT|nr:type II secretion system F family protein [Anatilimnocola aggregata]QDU30005.1 Bacterial type II secretion system protein F domain protein [Anatilimnocola aggregata]
MNQILTNPIFVQIAVFGLIAALTWLAIEFFSGSNSRAEQRLEDFRDPVGRKKREEGGRKGDNLSRMLEAASPALAKPLQPKTEAEMNKVKLKLSYAGFRSEGAPMVFQAAKFLGLMIGLFLGGGITILTYGFTQGALMKVVLLAGGFFYLPELVVMYLAKKRKESIFLGLPDALDLMVVCVEAGLGLDQAMRKVAEEMKKAYRNIADEFGLCNLQLQMGRVRSQVLQELGSRSGVDDLKSLASILIQADKFGSSIAQALRVQSEAMRTRRAQIAEEKAAKTAVKLIFPLVLFIFPGIFVILVGPAAITMVREMFPAMNKGG